MISVLCPTRNRAASVRRMVMTALATAAGPAEFVFYTDDDDIRSREILVELKDPGHVITVITGPRIVLSQMWNACAEKARGDIFMQCGDDIAFRTPGWDVAVREAIEQFPDRIAFAHGDDGGQGAALGTHGFVHRRWTEVLGYFVPPYFASDFNDVWLTDLADRIGRHVYLPHVLTEHMHPAWGKGEWDGTHQERLARHAATDPAATYAAKREERERDAEKLRAAMLVRAVSWADRPVPEFLRHRP